jgi:hypothetical protein
MKSQMCELQQVDKPYLRGQAAACMSQAPVSSTPPAPVTCCHLSGPASAVLQFTPTAQLRAAVTRQLRLLALLLPGGHPFNCVVIHNSSCPGGAAPYLHSPSMPHTQG